ncbi:MAG: hypothetical protein RLZZ321_448 [Bacteroidota bacterium]|jgi:hypothetical protein
MLEEKCLFVSFADIRNLGYFQTAGNNVTLMYDFWKRNKDV